MVTRESLPNVVFRFCSKTFQAAHTMLFYGLAELGGGIDGQFLKQSVGLFRPESGDIHQLAQAR
jgi:hypothetical protein